MLIRKIVLLFFLNLSILILPVAYAEANIEKININTADVLVLEKLYGIGPKKAADIVEFRDKNGLFESIDDLKKVTGIGQKTVDKNREIIEVVLIPEELPEASDKPADDPDEIEELPTQETTDKEVVEPVENAENEE